MIDRKKAARLLTTICKDSRHMKKMKKDKHAKRVKDAQEELISLFPKIIDALDPEYIEEWQGWTCSLPDPAKYINVVRVMVPWDKHCTLGGNFKNDKGLVQIEKQIVGLKSDEEQLKENIGWQTELTLKYPNGYGDNFDVEAYCKKELACYTTKERPFRIYICGTDDASYTTCVATVEDIIDFLINFSTPSDYDDLEKHNFIFTN